MSPSQRPSAKALHKATASVSNDLFDQPGHLLRRAHQIATGMFDELVGPDITPTQFAILRMVHELPGIDQVSLAREIGLDLSTTALTAARLQSRGMLDRQVSELDRRLLRLTLTAEGEALLASTVSGVHRMRERLLSSLPPDEREHFMELLKKFVHVNNESSRAPLRRREGQPQQQPPKNAGAKLRAAGKAEP